MRLIRLLKNDLAKEAQLWVEKDIINTTQAESICELYGADYNKANNNTLAYKALIASGFLCIGLALIILIGANWDDLSRELRTGGLVLLAFATQAFGLVKAKKEGLEKASGIFFLGNFFYGAAIILVAQIYHLGEHMPDGVYWWALGSLPFALICQSPLLMLQSFALASIWFCLEIYYGFFPVEYAIFLAGAFYVLTKAKSSIVLFISTIAGSLVWLEFAFARVWQEQLQLSLGAENFFISLMLFLIAHLVSLQMEQSEDSKLNDYGAILQAWCLRFLLVFLAVMSFKAPWSELISAQWLHYQEMLLALAILGVFSLLIAKRSGALLQCAIALSMMAGLALVIVQGQLNVISLAIWLQLIDNLIFVALGIFLVIAGINKGISHYFALGLCSILLVAFMRYVDLIGNYVGGAVLFIVFAAMLLLAANYWKRIQKKEMAHELS